jgi:EmrB/QacA subfamily drug resistance transporter
MSIGVTSCWYTINMNKQQRLVIIVAILASLVSFLDGSIITVALPTISQDLAGGLTLQQWIVDAYLITLGSLILVAGSVSDLFGRKKVIRAGLIGFGIASILCAIAPNGVFLIIARALQGIAGALLVPSSLALIIATFSGKQQGKAIGTWTAWTGVSFIIGPLLGGILIDVASWEWIFLINIVPIGLTLYLLERLAIEDQVSAGTKLDVRGAASGALGLGGSVYALIEQAHYGWTSPLVYGPLIVGIAALVYFVQYEKRAANAMLPFELFTVRNFAVGNIATIAVYAGLSVATFLISIFVQQYGGYSAFAAGLVLIPPTLIMLALSSRIGELSSKYGPRLFMGIGPLIAAIGFLSMLRVDEQVHYWSQLFPGIVLFGIGLSITVAPLTAAILGGIKTSQAGVGSAVNNAVARIAGLLAIAAVGLITGTGALSLEDFHKGAIFMTVLLALGGIISLVGIQNIVTLPDQVEAPEHT